ncbi:pilus assembly protein PilP [Rugamonas sp.]|uniref:pilus assembly protein PilP n=1 Tax=Rugamonas sp. TaxID=1926287 RepID=UPI0025D505BE|nr:pilus assembly protein PilP [Rugamonas sp.]
MSAPGRAVLPLAALLLPLLLAACGDSDTQEVKRWMEQVDHEARVAVPPLVAPKNFIPYAYASNDAIDPFSPNKLLAELAKLDHQRGGVKPDTERRKEVLESYPLDTIKMVGTMQKGSATYALLQVDKAVYQVQLGQHIGQNFGLVTGVSDAVVTIKEIVQDATGDWVERISKLELQESKESSK